MNKIVDYWRRVEQILLKHDYCYVAYPSKQEYNGYSDLVSLNYPVIKTSFVDILRYHTWLIISTYRNGDSIKRRWEYYNPQYDTPRYKKIEKIAVEDFLAVFDE